MDPSDLLAEMAISDSDNEEIHDDDVESVGDSESPEEEVVESETDTEEEEDEVGHVTDDDPDDVSEEMKDEDDEDEDSESSSENADSESSDDESAAPSTAIPISKPKNKRKRKNPKRWMQIVKNIQASTAYLIPRLPMRRLVREVAQDFQTDLKFTEECFSAIQTSAEDFLGEFMDVTNRAALHRGAITIAPKDMQVARYIMERCRWTGTMIGK
jgi:histone H3/H4